MRRFRTLLASLALALGLITFAGTAIAANGNDNGNGNNGNGNNDNGNNGNGNNGNSGNGNGNNGNGNGNGGNRGDVVPATNVPEIDPSSIGSALALLGFGAAMMIEGRRRK